MTSQGQSWTSGALLKKGKARKKKIELENENKGKVNGDGTASRYLPYRTLLRYHSSGQVLCRWVGDRRITVAMKGAQGVHADGDEDGDGAIQVRAGGSQLRPRTSKLID